MAVNIANAMANNGLESHICATRQEGALKAKLGLEVKYLFLNKKNTLDLKALKKLVHYIKFNEITIIHAHATSYFTAFLVKLGLPKVRIVWHNHFGNSKNLRLDKKNILSLVSKTFYTIISVNNELNQWAQLNLKAKHFQYLPNFALYGAINSKETLLQGSNEKRIVCLANLKSPKDHLNLLKAFEIVHKKHKDWTLHLVGMDFKDVYSEEIKSYRLAHHLEACVFLYGSCSDTQYILEQASIGVLGSKSEGLPVALLEYGLAKLPVVVTDVGECGTVVNNMENGLVVPPVDEERLAEALVFLIENENRRKEFGENLYIKVGLNYSENAFITQLITIYNFE
jgi:glycosyltransferase involved in cell wall biosynthesis